MRQSSSSSRYSWVAKLIFVVYLLFQSGCSSYPVVTERTIDLHRVQDIKKRLAALRGLDFTRAVPIEVKNEKQMRNYLKASLLRDYGEQKLKDMSLAYAKFGLLPRGSNLQQSLLDFYTAQVLAYYDPKEKSLTFPEDMKPGFTVGAVEFLPRRDVLDEMILAHELTHALQDQHFSLETKLRPSNNDDESLAMRAVVEGDASLSATSILSGRADSEYLTGISNEIQAELKQKREDFSEIPALIAEPLLFSYYGGVSFVARMLEERGWPGINRLYVSPPLSTEQVLHPKKYLYKPDPPTQITWNNLASILPNDWKEVENNVLGELTVQVLFKEYFSEKEAKKAASGWDGDRFVAFRNRRDIAFVWATIWDSLQDSEEFLKRYQKILSKRYPDSTSDSTYYIEQRGRRVLVVEGLKRSYTQAKSKMFWKKMKLKEVAFTRPFAPRQKVSHKKP
ncbi:MAG: hypothetical protein ACE5HC_07885 [Candidatus Binatia bacterium]